MRQSTDENVAGLEHVELQVRLPVERLVLPLREKLPIDLLVDLVLTVGAFLRQPHGVRLKVGRQ